MTLKKHVYFDYEFVYAASITKDLLFVENCEKLWRFYENHKNKLSAEERGTLEAFTLVGAIYASNAKQIQDYPESIVAQILARISPNLDPNLYELCQRFVLDSQCALLPVFTYLPITDAETADTLFYSESTIKCLIELKGRPNLMILSDRLFLLDLESGKVLEKLDIGEEIFKVLIGFESAPLKINNFKDLVNCRLIVVNPNQVRICRFNASLNFNICFDESIEETFLISSRHLFVKQRKEKFIQIFNITNGKLMVTQEFDFSIREVTSNVDQGMAFEFMFEKLNRLFLVIILETDDIFVMEFDAINEKLAEICKIPSPGQSSTKCLIDRCFFTTDLSAPDRSSDSPCLKFCLIYNLDFCVYEINGQLRLSVFNLRITDYFTFNLSCDLLDFYDQNILFIGNSCLYVYSLGNWLLFKLSLFKFYYLRFRKGKIDQSRLR